MVKRLVDIDDDALEAARAVLGTDTIKATVNESLRRVGTTRISDIQQAVAALAEIDFEDRSEAWR